MKYLRWKLRHKAKRLLLKYSLLPRFGEDVDWNGLCYEPIRYGFTLELSFSITGEDIEDILSLAIRRSSFYWCKKVTPVVPFAGNLLSEHGVLSFLDKDGNSHELTIPKLLEGFRLYLLHGGNLDRDEEGRIDTRDIGGTEADAIVQYALFGKIIYE